MQKNRTAEQADDEPDRHFSVFNRQAAENVRPGEEARAQSGADGQHRRRQRLQLAEEELALDLKADDEEEDRHEPVVDPVQHAQIEVVFGGADGQFEGERRFVASRPGAVGEHHGKHGKEEQQDAARRFMAEEGLDRFECESQFLFHDIAPFLRKR